MSALREARTTIGFLRSVVRSGEGLDVHDNARIDAALDLLARASLTPETPDREAEVARIAAALICVDDDAPGAFNELAITDEASRPLAAALYDHGLRAPSPEPSE